MSDDRDTCDRCHKLADRIHVGHEGARGFDGLCDDCLDELRSRIIPTTLF